jgi:macrolide-specific efflux system membrane fusion protein
VAALQGSDKANQQTAQVVAVNGQIESREVHTGISDRLKVQILDGLSEGDHLLIGPADGNGG